MTFVSFFFTAHAQANAQNDSIAHQISVVVIFLSVQTPSQVTKLEKDQPHSQWGGWVPLSLLHKGTATTTAQTKRVL